MTEKILIVDDIKTNRILLGKMLDTMNDYAIFEAVDGEDAIEIVERANPDLILMDINMPKMNGYQSAEAIKKISGNVYLPIIFITALSAEASMETAIDSGGDDFISKPFNAELLKSKIQAHLRIRALSLQINEKNIQLANHNQQLTKEQDLIEHFFDCTMKKNFLDRHYIKYHMSSMSAFNGDLLLVERGTQGGLYLIMGDFTGHGLPAAMGTIPVAMIFFKLVKEGKSIGEIARELNEQLNNIMPLGMFFAATLIHLNACGDKISIWAGGLPDSFWLSKSGELKGEIRSQHMPLGILGDNAFEATTQTLDVALGDNIYLYSDGLTEATDPQGQMFGEHRLKEILTQQDGNRFDAALHRLNTFTGTTHQTDDITLVQLSCFDTPVEACNDANGGDSDIALP